MSQDIGDTSEVARGLGLGCSVDVVFREADDLDSGRRDLVLGDEFAGEGVPERDAWAVDDDVELGSGVGFADSVDDVADADPPVVADDSLESISPNDYQAAYRAPPLHGRRRHDGGGETGTSLTRRQASLQ